MFQMILLDRELCRPTRVDRLVGQLGQLAGWFALGARLVGYVLAGWHVCCLLVSCLVAWLAGWLVV